MTLEVASNGKRYESLILLQTVLSSCKDNQSLTAIDVLLKATVNDINTFSSLEILQLASSGCYDLTAVNTLLSITSSPPCNSNYNNEYLYCLEILRTVVAEGCSDLTAVISLLSSYDHLPHLGILQSIVEAECLNLSGVNSLLEFVKHQQSQPNGNVSRLVNTYETGGPKQQLDSRKIIKTTESVSKLRNVYEPAAVSQHSEPVLVSLNSGWLEKTDEDNKKYRLWNSILAEYSDRRYLEFVSNSVLNKSFDFLDKLSYLSRSSLTSSNKMRRNSSRRKSVSIKNPTEEDYATTDARDGLKDGLHGVWDSLIKQHVGDVSELSYLAFVSQETSLLKQMSEISIAQPQQSVGAVEMNLIKKSIEDEYSVDVDFKFLNFIARCLPSDDSILRRTADRYSVRGDEELLFAIRILSQTPPQNYNNLSSLADSLEKGSGIDQVLTTPGMDFNLLSALNILCETDARTKLENRCITTLQRMGAACNSRSFLRMHHSAKTIQRFVRYRHSKQRHSVMKLYKTVLKATQKLKALLHGRTTRQAIQHRHTAAVIIQNRWRVCGPRIAFVRYINRRKYAALQIQKNYRRYSAQLRVQKLISHRSRLVGKALVIQRIYRGFASRKRIKELTSSAAKIQKIFKGHAVREANKTAAIHRKASTSIQKWWRTVYLKYKNTSSTQIQRVWRGSKQRSINKVIKLAVLTIQRAVRTLASMNLMYNMLFIVKTDKATLIQACVRRHIVRRNIRRRYCAARKIQDVVRRFVKRKKISSAILIQKTFRSYVERNATHSKRANLRMTKQEIRQQESILLVQKWFRGAKSRRILNQQQEAARTIQRCTRMHQAGLNTHVKRVIFNLSAGLIQACWRARPDRMMIQSWKRAAVTIQKVTRSHLARQHILRKRDAAYVIQIQYRYFRIVRNRQLAFASIEHDQQQQASICIQTGIRGFLARKTKAYKNCEKQEETKLEIEKMRHRERCAAATTIQSHWRGYSVRVWYEGRQTGLGDHNHQKISKYPVLSWYSPISTVLPLAVSPTISHLPALSSGSTSLFSGSSSFNRSLLTTPGSPLNNTRDVLLQKIQSSHVQLAQVNHHLFLQQQEIENSQRLLEITRKREQSATNIEKQRSGVGRRNSKSALRRTSKIKYLVTTDEVVVRSTITWDEELQRETLLLYRPVSVIQVSTLPPPTQSHPLTLHCVRNNGRTIKPLKRNLLEKSRRLDLSNKGLTDVSVYPVVKLLKGDHQIRELILDSNNITDSTCCEIAELLDSNNTLETLSFRDNEAITNESAEQILNLIKNRNSSLRIVDFTHTSVSQNQILRVKSALKSS